VRGAVEGTKDRGRNEHEVDSEIIPYGRIGRKLLENN
jgi:hypothetical protein